MIANDAQARDAIETISKIDIALSSESALQLLVNGLPTKAVESLRRVFQVERKDISEQLGRYEQARAGAPDELLNHAINDHRAILIAARVARGLSQKELARMLGLREQQIQRYEAERYRSISFSNYQKFALVLGLELSVKPSTWRPDVWNLLEERVDPSDARKVLRHAKANGWFEKNPISEEDGISQLKRMVAEHKTRHGLPSLLRTGLNVHDISSDWKLLAWKAQVGRKAERAMSKRGQSFDPLDAKWLLDLIKLSSLDDGPSQVASMLLSKGIILVVEPKIAGMSLDGAAFLVDGVPTIGLTLQRDYIDNFWFTLLHELAHVFLHRHGLASGFFDEFSGDDSDEADLDEIECEANDFASEILIPSEKWKRSPARISKTAAPVEKFAAKLGIHPAIVFGRIRYERKNFSLFAKRIGTGKVRKQFADFKQEDSL